MASSFAWLDTSEVERRRALDVIDAFRDRDTRDELGLGSIRDGLADLLFPGTTTIQTRAGYFLFVPWIYRDLERRRVPSRRVASEARRMEIDLIEPLARETPEGVVGIDARASLKRLPSSIYWQGLGTWGLRRFAGSREEYHRSFDAFQRNRANHDRDDDGEHAGGVHPNPNWDPGIPEAPASFPKEASMTLRAEDADYLCERIALHHPHSLLAHLARSGPWEPVPFAWLHPEHEWFPASQRRHLHHARAFSELIHGAQLLYNLMLAEEAASEERNAGYRESIDEWVGLVDARWDALAEWASDQIPEFWDLLAPAGVGLPTRTFVEAWLQRVLAVGPRRVADDRRARHLIHEREVRLKRGLARLENRAALATWGGAAGAGRLDMRWGITQRLLADILTARGDGGA